MNVVWIGVKDVERTPLGYTSTFASSRYRAILPARELVARGHSCTFFTVPPTRAADGSVNRAAIPGVDALLENIAGACLVFNKFHNLAAEELAAEAKRRGARVVVDICDNYLLDKGIAEHYKAMAGLADQVTAPTTVLAQLVKMHCGRDAVVIPDPYEGPAGEARFAPENGLRMLWFGHITNLPSLLPVLPDLAGPGHRIEIVTAPHPDLEPTLARLQKKLGEGLALHFTPWRLEGTWQALAACDLVVLPTLNTPQHIAKSPNRMVETLRAGRIALAHPHPALTPFRHAAWIAQDLGAGLRQILAMADAIPERIRAGQAHIEQHHAPARVADLWEKCVAA